MEEPKVFTLKEHLDAIEAAYGIGASKDDVKNKQELLACLNNAVTKWAETINIKQKTDGKS